MTRKVLLISEDERFVSFVEISALTLSKLNHQVDLIRKFDNNIDLAIIDFDTIVNLEIVKLYRNGDNSRNKKIIGVYSPENNIDRDEIFKNGCDSLMSKTEFERVGNNILMF